VSYKRDKLQVKKFAEVYVNNNLNGKKAMQAISPELEPQALSNKKHRWLSSPEVISEITAYIASLNITPAISKDLIRHRLIKIITNEDSKDSDAIQAGSVLGRLEGVYNEGQVSNNLAIFGDVLGELKTISVKSMPKEVVIEPPIEQITVVIPQKLATDTV